MLFYLFGSINHNCLERKKYSLANRSTFFQHSKSILHKNGATGNKLSLTKGEIDAIRY